MNVNTIVMANSCNFSTVFLVEVNSEGNTRISGAWVTTGAAMEYIEMLDADLRRNNIVRSYTIREIYFSQKI